MQQLARCAGCNRFCWSGQMIDDTYCATCWHIHATQQAILAKQEEQRHEAEHELAWATPAQAARYAALKVMYQPNNGGW